MALSLVKYNVGDHDAVGADTRRQRSPFDAIDGELLVVSVGTGYRRSLRILNSCDSIGIHIDRYPRKLRYGGAHSALFTAAWISCRSIGGSNVCKSKRRRCISTSYSARHPT